MLPLRQIVIVAGIKNRCAFHWATVDYVTNIDEYVTSLWSHVSSDLSSKQAE